VISNKYNFRWDIQGLRAIAVLFVVVFHINPNLLPGGYLGVDIFFVISGYLILGFIWRDLNQKNFQLTRFYSKRFYRLAPALLVMVFVTSVVGYFILLPNEGVTYVESLFSTLFYFSNFYFYSQSDYFNTAMEFAPLLHTWSLSVEEQFYILFPFILLFIFKIKKESILYILSMIGVLSLILSQLSIYYDQNSFAFFASPTRFFQFIIGGLIAIGLEKNIFTKTVNDILGFIGLGIISITVFLFTPHTAMPGINALWPSLGVALVLYSGVNAKYTTSLLSNTLFKYIGNASYSIYLWHWPLIVFYKLKISPILSGREEISLFLISIILGYLSWKFIEENLRKGYLQKFNVFVVHIALNVILGVVVYFIFTVFQVKTTQYKENINKYMHHDVASQFRAGTCFLTSTENSIKFYQKDECISWDKDKKNYLLIGDSHAAHYYSAMASLLKKNETLSQVTSSACLPIFPFKWGAKKCIDLHRWALNSLIKEKHFDVIILSIANLNRTTNLEIKQTISHMLKYTNKVVILGPSMKYKQSLLRLLVELPEGHDSSMIYKNTSDYEYTLNIDNTMKNFLQMDRLEYISTLKVLCKDEEGCRTLTPRGVPMYFDRDHFTEDGARFMLKQVVNKVFDRE